MFTKQLSRHVLNAIRWYFSNLTTFLYNYFTIKIKITIHGINSIRYICFAKIDRYYYKISATQTDLLNLHFDNGTGANYQIFPTVNIYPHWFIKNNTVCFITETKRMCRGCCMGQFAFHYQFSTKSLIWPDRLHFIRVTFVDLTCRTCFL